MSAELVFSGTECSLAEFPTQSHNLIHTLFAVEKFAIAFEECTDIGDSHGNAIESISDIKQTIYDIIDAFRGKNSAEDFEKTDVLKELEVLKLRNSELEKRNEELSKENEMLLEKLGTLESEGTGAEKNIIEGNRQEILRLHDLIESSDLKHSIEVQDMETKLEALKRRSQEMEEALEFEKAEKDAMREHFEIFKCQKETELKKLQQEIDQADQYYMALNKGRGAEKENTLPEEKQQTLGESLSTAKLNTTNTISSNISLNMDDTLLMNPPSDSLNDTQLGIGALISILKKIYDISNLLVQYMKGNCAVDPKTGWIEKCRSQRKMLYELLELLKKAEKSDLDAVTLNISSIAQHLSLMARTLETVTKLK